MQIIAVDIGNSAIKFFAGEDQLRLPRLSGVLPADFADTLKQRLALVESAKPLFWAVTSVDDAQSQLLKDWVKHNRAADRFEVITRDQVPLDVVESYRKSVGIDRLIAAYAAVSQAGKSSAGLRPMIVVDAGTAVTIDVVSIGERSEHRFEGGLIFPGAGSSLSVLNSATADLPDVSLSSVRLSDGDFINAIVGTQTEMAIANGVCFSQAHAVAGIVAELKNHLPGAEVWITGGGSESILSLLDDKTTREWTADALLVLRGSVAIGQQILSNDCMQ